MRVKCSSFEDCSKWILENDCRIIIFGSGTIGQISSIEVLKNYNLIGKIDCFVDNDKSKWGNTVDVYDRKVEIRSTEYISDCHEDSVIMISISRFSDSIIQLESLLGDRNTDCYIIPMMLIHNYCLTESEGCPMMADKPLIPQKLHYMWLGRKNLPAKLQKCIDSWHKFCPEFEIIQWNEDNYDISKNEYMKQAYESGAYGFVPDYARLDIIYNHGGIYLDTDVEVRKSLKPLLYQEAFCGVEKWQTINLGGCFGAVKGNHFVKMLLDNRDRLKFINKDGTENRITCGYYDTKVALENGYIINGKTQNVMSMNIYAYDYFHPYDYMTGGVNETANTYSIHWFNGGWLDETLRRSNELTMKTYDSVYNKAVVLK